MTELINNYKRELSYKINQKRLPNRTKEQILFQHFKYFDLDGNGMCNLRNFIKTNERVGVVLSKLKDIEDIFNYFDVEKNGYISYKGFCKEIFNSTISNSKNNKELSNGIKENDVHDMFISKLIDVITKAGGPCAFVNFVKKIQISDYNGRGQITIDEFVKVINECNLIITKEHYQLLLKSYEFLTNGILYYMRIINRIIDSNWNQQKEKEANDIYERLLFKVKRFTLNDIKRLFNESEYDKEKKENFSMFIEGFKFIMNIYRQNAPMKKNEFVNLIKYYGYNSQFEEELKQFLINISEIKSEHNYNSNDNIINRSNDEKGKKNLKVESIINLFINNIRKFERKTLFNFIKHFKYFDNNRNIISKYDFAKVIKNYRINLPLIEIEELYKEYAIDNNKTYLQYEYFLKLITDTIFNNKRKNKVVNAYNSLISVSKKQKSDMTIDFITSNYNPKKNILNQDEFACKNEFDDTLELFHFCYKQNKSMNISLDEFIEYYSFISLLIEKDDDFINMITIEWIKAKNDYQQEENINNNTYKQEPPKLKLQPIHSLEKKLIFKGVRGLLYLHRQFLISCADITKITLNDFISVLQLQGINMRSDEYKDIFMNFSNNNEYLDFFAFIRNFKKQLNNYKLKCVERVYSSIDIEENEHVPYERIKELYNASRHPDVINGNINEEKKKKEFTDCFEINFYQLMNNNENPNDYVTFEIFANFYEYVAFVYKEDKQFEKIIKATWSY